MKINENDQEGKGEIFTTSEKLIENAKKIEPRMKHTS